MLEAVEVGHGAAVRDLHLAAHARVKLCAQICFEVGGGLVRAPLRCQFLAEGVFNFPLEFLLQLGGGRRGRRGRTGSASLALRGTSGERITRSRFCARDFRTGRRQLLPLLPTREGGEGRGEEVLSRLGGPSLRLSPRSFLAGRERRCALIPLRFMERRPVLRARPASPLPRFPVSLAARSSF